VGIVGKAFRYGTINKYFRPRIYADQRGWETQPQKRPLIFTDQNGSEGNAPLKRGLSGTLASRNRWSDGYVLIGAVGMVISFHKGQAVYHHTAGATESSGYG
jgi:hypothetical protein